MFGNGELAQLNVRKAELLAQSDRNRRELLANCAQLQPVVSGVESGIRIARRIKPLLLVVAPLLGIWAVRKGKPRSGLWRKLSVGWRLWEVGVAVWKGFQSDKT